MKLSKFLRGNPVTTKLLTEYRASSSPYLITGAVIGGKINFLYLMLYIYIILYCYVLYLYSLYIAVVLIIGIWYVWRLRSQARMREEVRSILFEYYPLEDPELGSNSSLNSGLL